MSYSSRSFGMIPAYRPSDRGGLHRAARCRIEPTDQVPTFEKIVHPDFLLSVFYDLKRNAGQAPGLDRTRYSDLGRQHAPMVMRFIGRMLKDECYRHGPTRPVPIPKKGGFRTLQLANLPDRVVSAAVNTAMTPFWESVFHPRSFGFRPHVSGWHLLAKLHADIVTTGRSVIVVDDIKKAFNNVPIATTMANHERHIESPSLLALIDVVLRGSEGDSRLIGLDQGSAYSPTALNVLLHHAHDLWAELRDLLWYRYADNLVYLCRNMSEGQEVHQEVDAILRKTGLELKREDGPPKDLLAGETAQLLGFTVAMVNGRLRLTPGVEALTKLQDNLERCHECENPPLAAAQVVNGWIAYQGPTFGGEREQVLETVLETAAHYGFREMNPDSLLKQWEYSWKRWNWLRRKAVSSNQPRVETSGVSGRSYRWRPPKRTTGKSSAAAVSGADARMPLGIAPETAESGADETAGNPLAVIRPVEQDVREILTPIHQSAIPAEQEVACRLLSRDEPDGQPESRPRDSSDDAFHGRRKPSRARYRPGIVAGQPVSERPAFSAGAPFGGRKPSIPQPTHRIARPRNRAPPCFQWRHAVHAVVHNLERRYARTATISTPGRSRVRARSADHSQW